MTDERRAWTIRIPKWETFQTYKDRNPPWIKLYRELLDKNEWRKLHGSAAKLLVDLWMLAAQSERGQRPNGELHLRLEDLAYRVRVPEAEVTADLAVLQAFDFVDVSTTLHAKRTISSESVRKRSPETETERETETESNGGPSGAGIRPLGNWVVEFGSAWKARFQGVVPFKRIGHALKPLRAEYADAEILSRWERYLSRVEGRFASPEDFAKKFGEWGGSAPAGGVSRNAAISRAIDALGVVDAQRIPSHGFPTEAQFAQWLEHERERMAS